MKNQRIETVKYLMSEIEDELYLAKHYEEARHEAMQLAKSTGKQHWQCMYWDRRYPKKARIIDRCKIARQILMEISKEAEQL